MVRLGQLRSGTLANMKGFAEYLNVPLAAAALSMHQFAWSRDSLLEQYDDQSDQILQKAGVFCRCTADGNSATASGTLACSI
jgi:hypothetical protein